MTPVTRRSLLAMTGAVGLAASHRAAAQARTRLGVVFVGWPENEVKPMIDNFHAAHPTIEAGLERIPFAELVQTLEVRLGARTPSPDIFCCDGPLTASYAARGHLLDLTPVFGPERDRFTAAAWNQGTVQDKLYSAPFQSSSQLMYVNLRHFKAAGIEPPAADVTKRWTWEQVAETAARLTDRSKEQWGLVIEQSERPYQLLPLPQSKGAKVISDDGLTVGDLFEAQPFVDSVQFYADLFNKLNATPKGVYDFALAREMFATGRAAMFVGGTWGTDLFAQRKELEWAVAPFPAFAGGRPVTSTGSWHLGINPRSRNQEQAITFLRYMLSDANQDLWWKLRPGPPALNATWTSLGSNFQTPAWQITRHELANNAMPRPKTPGWREYEDLLRLAFRDIQGGAEVKPRLARAAREIDRELAKYRS